MTSTRSEREEPMRVRCPICEEVVDVSISPRLTIGMLANHEAQHQGWSQPHANGFVTGVTITVKCVGSGAKVRIARGLDRRTVRLRRTS